MNPEFPFTPLMRGCALRLFASALLRFEETSLDLEPLEVKLVVEPDVGAEGGIRTLARAIQFLREVGFDVTKVNIGSNYDLAGDHTCELASTSATILMKSTAMYRKIRFSFAEPA